MTDDRRLEQIHTRIWLEEPEAENPFATRKAYCRGYDVYGEMLGRSRWVDILFLLFRDEPPLPDQATLLEALAVTLANPGPRDASVHAAMCGGVGGSTAASCLMAALAVGAGHNAGAREILSAMQIWNACGTQLDGWRTQLSAPKMAADTEVWPTPEHPPGFDPHGVSASLIVRQTLDHFVNISPGPCLPWLATSREALEQAAGLPLSLSGVAAAAFVDLGFTPEQGEMLYLLLRLPGAAAHALEQRGHGYKKFPFFTLDIENDPGPKPKRQEPR